MDSCTEIKSDVTKSGRVWRKVPESDARSERGGVVTVLGAGRTEGRGLGGLCNTWGETPLCFLVRLYWFPLHLRGVYGRAAMCM